MKDFDGDALLRVENLPSPPGQDWEPISGSENYWVLELFTDRTDLINQVSTALLEIGDLRRQFPDARLYLHLNASSDELRHSIKLEPSLLKLLGAHDVILEFWCS